MTPTTHTQFVIDTSRFAIHGDGTAIDTGNELMWMRPLLGQTIDADGKVVGEPHRMTLDDASAAALAADFAGHSDWRVPTFQELMTLLEASADNEGKRLDTRVFGNEGRELWCSSERLSGLKGAFFLSVYDGCAYGTGRNGYKVPVRLVRGGMV